MSVILVLVLLILLLGAVAVFLLARNRAVTGRSELLRSAAATTALALIFWLVGARQLPLQWTLVPALGGLEQPLWELVVDEVAWQFTFWLMLTGLIVFALATYTEQSTNDSMPDGITVAFLLVLLGTGLLASWASSLSGLAFALALMAVIWTVVLWRAEVDPEQRASLLARTVFLLIAQLCLMMASTNAVNYGATGLDMATWPVSATTWVLMAAVIQMGIFPLNWWRPLKHHLAWPTAPFIHLLPATSGALLLLRLVVTSPTGTGYTLFVTGFGLLGLLYAASLAWLHHDRPGTVVAALAVAQVSIILLVAAWADSEAVLAELKVLLLALTGLFVANKWSRARPTWMFVGLIVAAAAIVGLPLTAGFNGRLALYSAWLTDGRFVLLLVASLIYVPIVAAILLLFWPKSKSGRVAKEAWSWSLAGELVAWLLLVLGLIAWPDLSLSADHLVAVIFITVTFAGGIMLGRYVGQVREVQDALRQSWRVGESVRRATQTTMAALISAGSALREAAAILEGESGLLWLLLLLAALWLAQNI